MFANTLHLIAFIQSKYVHLHLTDDLYKRNELLNIDVWIQL